MKRVYTSYIGQLTNIHERYKDAKIVVIMRYYPGYLDDYDYLHAPILSPEPEILNAYLDEEISREEFKERFKKQLYATEGYLKLVRDMIAYEHDVFMVCVEIDPEECHRSVVAESINELFNAEVIKEWRKETENDN